MAAIRPADLDRDEPGRNTKTEVQTQIVGRVEAGSAADLIDPNPPNPMKCDASADSIPIRVSAYQAQSEPVIPIESHVDEQHREVTQIVDYCVQTAIIEQIANRHAPARLGLG